MRNVGLIEHIVELNIYYQGYRKRIEINMISGQKWSVILGMPWLGCYNPEIDWRIEEVKMMRCPEKCEKKQKKKEKKETKKGENDKSKEGGRKIGDLG